MRFADIPGHERVKDRLREMVDAERIPHAILLEGPAGAGKFAMVRALTAYIHCTDRHDGDSCGRCEACRQHASFNHIDTLYSFPVIKKNSKPTVSDDYATAFHEFVDEYPFMPFDKWQLELGNINSQPLIYVEEATAMLERLTLTARRSQFKVVAMWLPERLHSSAANKLLKLVEEPASDTLFIMSSDNPADILPTIYSRTQRIKVSRYSDDEVAAMLIERGVDPEAASVTATLAEGNMNRAFDIVAGNKISSKMLDLYMALMRLAWKRQVLDLRRWSVEVADLGREGLVRFYTYASRMTRDNFMLNLGNQSIVALTAEEEQFSSRFCAFITERNIENIINEFDRAASDTASNGNAKIIAFDLAVKMIKLLR
ncbi:MAG: DNA polymerase III subunit delta [Odoribacter sp.]|nr:DNA polymerase III subunit delta [Odoribacter sp.]